MRVIGDRPVGAIGGTRGVGECKPQGERARCCVGRPLFSSGAAPARQRRRDEVDVRVDDGTHCHGDWCGRGGRGATGDATARDVGSEALRLAGARVSESGLEVYE